MSCYKPLHGWLSKSRNASGKRSVVFNRSDGLIDRPLTVPCGQCIGCRLERSRQWAMRCVFESELYDDNCFLTLTYDNEHLPVDMSLNSKDIQLFMKRLRKHMISFIRRKKIVKNKYPLGHKIRFFQCGEYGDKFARPHHHVCLFNCSFDDLELWSVNQGCSLYTSETLQKLWPFGYSLIGDVTFESAAYVARYITKKITGKRKEEHYGSRKPEFVTMSRKPGIAADWFDKFFDDVYSSDLVVIRDGLTCKPPKFFDDRYDAINHQELSRLKAIRKRKGESNPDNSDDRLEVREQVQEKKQKLFKERKYEK